MTPKRIRNNKSVRLSFAQTPLIPIEPAADQVASNENLLMDILSRLPTRFLVRSMRVSKEWNTLIRNPIFHKLRNPNPEPPSGLFIPVSSSEYAKCEFVPYDIGNPVKPPHLNPKFDPEANNIFTIQNAVNGLFLCTGVRNKDYVYNPTINQFSRLNVRDNDSCLVGMSLAFDPSISPHYKIAYVYCLEEGKTFEIRVYSSETRTCKPACIVKLMYNISDLEMEFKGGVYWNNAVHWISDNRFVLYFNFDRESVHKISTPSVRKNVNYIFESRGHFLDVEMNHPVDSTLKIHELKRDYSEWFVKYIVDLKEIGWSFTRLFRRGSPVTLQTTVLDLVLGEKEDDSFLVVEIPWTVLRFNLVSKTFHTLHDFTTYRDFSRPMKGQSPIYRYPLTFQFREFIFSL